MNRNLFSACAFSTLTPARRGGYLVFTSPPWVSTPGRKAASPDVAFAFLRYPAAAGGTRG
jgi:hypothetical protein